MAERIELVCGTETSFDLSYITVIRKSGHFQKYGFHKLELEKKIRHNTSTVASDISTVVSLSQTAATFVL